MSTERKVEYWSVDPEAERLSHGDIFEALEAWADDQHPQPLPETVTVYGWARMERPSVEEVAQDIVEHLAESLLFEELHDPEEGPGEVSPRVQEAALEFAKVYLEDLHVWACEPVTEEEVRVADYIKEEP